MNNDDNSLFQNLMRSVTPLKPSKTVASYKKPVRVPTRIKQHHELPHDRIVSSAPFSLWTEEMQEAVKTHSILSYCSHTIPKKRLQQLQKGEIPYDARLDLHGFKLSIACDTLVSFIEQHLQLQHRCLLIIHGKGSHQGETPMLKNQVNHILKQIPAVLAFHSALDKHGGTGAVYVLLKRQR